METGRPQDAAGELVGARAAASCPRCATSSPRVTWPSRREVWATTFVVIVTSIFFGFVPVDSGPVDQFADFGWIFRTLGAS